MNFNKKTSIVIVVLIAMLIIVSSNISLKFVNAADNIYEQMKRFMEVFNIVKQYYVEDVNSEEIITGAIQGMLEGLDPHSVYIEAKQLSQIDERFKGHYYGIGIEFIIKNKILTVVSPIAGSPSYALGIRPHDQIIKIEGNSAYGINEQEVFDKLRGPKGSKVTVTIKRPGIGEPFDITITRDKIPIYSVMTSFLLNDATGYIYVGRFAKTTVTELEQALIDLENRGMKQLILDLRGNSGGYLNQAVLISDKFVDGDKKIVYTRGRRSETNEDFYATNKNTHPRYPLIILIDNGSASASEIVAGAIQDWDRGLIVGETSFGKGLVQNQIPLKDGSALRLTTAKYYTPSGRLIQRPYKNGLMDYYQQGYDDIDPNALTDSTDNKPVFYTNAGRKVFGGGGITPDVKIKSPKITRFTSELISKRIFFDFASIYSSKRKDLASQFDKFYNNFEVNETLLNNFKDFLKNKDIEINDKDFVKDTEFIKLLIKSEIARNLWDSRSYYQIRMSGDHQVTESIKLFPDAAKIAGIAYRN